jgi:hypothetical protein
MEPFFFFFFFISKRLCIYKGGLDKLYENRAQQASGVLMEFFPGFTLKDPEVRSFLSSPVSGPKLLHQLGSMILVDMLLNNFDRTPCIWSHLGNANNLIFRHSDGGNVDLCTIDQGCSPIINEQGLVAYLLNVEHALQEALTQDIRGPHITKVCTYLTTWTGGDVLPDAAVAHIQRGLVDAAKAVVAWDVTEVPYLWEDMMKHFQGWAVHNPTQQPNTSSFIARVHAQIAAVLEGSV